MNTMSPGAPSARSARDDALREQDRTEQVRRDDLLVIARRSSRGAARAARCRRC